VAETLAAQGRKVTYVTHFDCLGPYLRFTLEEQRMYQRLISLGVEILSQHLVVSYEPGRASLVHAWGGQERTLGVDSLALATGRYSDCALYDGLLERDSDRAAAGIAQLHLIGDAHTPGMLAQAVFSGHRLAREIDAPDPDVPLPFIRERRLIGSTEADYSLPGAPSLARETLSMPGGAGQRALTDYGAL
jgi:dimethylamine/trimethylamine dehydrogenase